MFVVSHTPTPADCELPPSFIVFLERLASAAVGLELRLDMIPDLTGTMTATIFDRAHHSGVEPLIATCRVGRYDDATRIALLRAAGAAGATHIDLDLASTTSVFDSVRAIITEHSGTLIVSHHDDERTPPVTELARLVDACFHRGARIAKLACRVRTERDCARLIGVLDDPRPIVVAGLGPRGGLLRVVAPLLGAPFTYVARDSASRTAPGQLTLDSAQAITNRIELETERERIGDG